ncbi:DUF6090 family protein [Pareuzebyella sediminis]|uniref:DUF6090 family protein n=1 Tax=Pareuzebyella sediminis TaxID=2607998 RepID=UPI0011EF0B72|nr:DUF6090 family protein [Pareuzebyella sediminis]
MIKFFRKIRQNLLSEGKTGKYFKYAIGEIVLVVIGILIALQINNWNENVKKLQQEKIYYCKIKEDLESDKINIKRSLESLNERISSAKRALNNLYDGANKSVILEDYLSAIRSIKFLPSKLAIQDIVSSGKLENFKNANLKDAIIQHYTDLDGALNRIVANNKDIGKYIYEYNLSDFGIHQLSLYENDFGIELLEKMPNVDWNNDKNNLIYKQFQDHMSISIIVSAREKQILNQVLSSAENLISELEYFCK